MEGMTIRTPTDKDAMSLSLFSIKTFMITFGHLYPPSESKKYLDSNYTEQNWKDLMKDEKYGIWIAMIPNNSNSDNSNNDSKDGSNINTSDDDHKQQIEKETMIGFCMSGPSGLPTSTEANGELKKLYIDTPYFGVGLSSTLFEMGIAWLRIHYSGYKIYLSVYSDNFRAQKFYNRYGFDKVGEYEYIVGDVRDKEFIYCEMSPTAGLPLVRR